MPYSTYNDKKRQDFPKSRNMAHTNSNFDDKLPESLIPSSEIKEKITHQTVDVAKEWGEYLAKDGGHKAMTTSQLRRFYGEVKRQQANGYNESDFVLLQPKLAYAVGRDKGTKIRDFYKLMTGAMQYVTNSDEFNRFVKVFEAIVAFHKANSKEK